MAEERKSTDEQSAEPEAIESPSVSQPVPTTEPDVETGPPLVPEVDTGPGPEAPTTRAMVPAAPVGRFQGTITRFLERVMPAPNVEIPPELYERIDAVEVQIAGIEELLTKRLEEGEGRTLHLVEKRLEVLGDDVGRLARRAAEREVANETRALRMQIMVIGGLAVGLSAAAFAKALGVF